MMRGTALSALLVATMSLAGEEMRAQSANTSTSAGLVRLGPPTLTLGDEDSGGQTTFGGISSVALDGKGDLYVLDYGDHSIRRFDSRGRFVTRAGRAGRGPGDLAAPNRLMHDGDSTLYVTDEVNGIIEFRTSGGLLRHVRTFGAELRPRSSCLFRNELVVGGSRGERTIHFVGTAGQIERSIGSPFPFKAPVQVKQRVDTSDVLREFASRASVVLACSSSRGLLVVAQASGPIVRAYRPDGTLAWEHEIPDYAGNTYFLQNGGPGIVYGKDLTLSTVILGDSAVLVQVSRRQQGSTGVGRARRMTTTQLWLSTTLLELATGRVLQSTRSFPLLLAVRDGLSVEMEEEPFPTLRLRPILSRRR